MTAGPLGVGGPPPPPVKPASYVPEKDWATYIQNVGGGQRGGGVSSTSCVYNTNGAYHFTLQPEWATKARQIIQPHITLNNNNNAKYYDPAYPLSPAATMANANAPANFAGSGVNYAALILGFTASAVTKKTNFEASREYDEEEEEYRAKYPWGLVLKLWVDGQLAAHTELVVQFVSGEKLVIVEQGPDPRPALVKPTDLLDEVSAPDSLDKYNYTFLSNEFRVVMTGSGVRFIRITKLTSARKLAVKKGSTDETMLNRSVWFGRTLTKIPSAINSCVLARGLDGREEGGVIVFALDGTLRQTTTTSTGPSSKPVLSSVDFARDAVPPCLRQIIGNWLPSVAVDDPQFEEKAVEAVTEAAKGCHFVRAGAEVWIIPKDAISAAKGDSLKVGLPRYRAIDPWRPRALVPNPDRVILQGTGSEYYLAPADALRDQLQATDSVADGIVVIRKGSGTETPALKRPAELTLFDFERYSWLNAQPAAKFSPCGSETLIMLPDGTCTVLREDAEYNVGGACFVATNTPDAVCFVHPVTGGVFAAAAGVLPTLTVVPPHLVLALSGNCVLMNERREWVVCPLLLSAPADITGIVAVGDDTGFLGFADIGAAEYLTGHTFVDEGYLVAKVPVTLDDTLNGFIHQDNQSGTLTCYDFQAFGTAPMSADNDKVTEFIADAAAASHTMFVVDGTDGYDGVELIVKLRGEHPLTVATVLHWVRPDECIVTYNGSTAWDDCACVILVTEFAGSGCDLVLFENGNFRGYAVSATALVAWTVVLSEAQRYSSAGSLHTVPAYTLVDDVADEQSYDTLTVVAPPTANILESFIGVVVQADPTLEDYLDEIANGNTWYLVDHGDTNAPTLCIRSDPEHRVLVLPDNQTLNQALDALRDGDGNLPLSNEEILQGLTKTGHDFHLPQ